MGRKDIEEGWLGNGGVGDGIIGDGQSVSNSASGSSRYLEILRAYHRGIHRSTHFLKASQ